MPETTLDCTLGELVGEPASTIVPEASTAAPEPLTLPEPVHGLARAVADAYATHEAHTEQRFARRLADTFRAMTPADDGDEKTRALRRGVEMCARTALRLAGLLDASGCSRTNPDAPVADRDVSGPDGTGEDR